MSWSKEEIKFALKDLAKMMLFLIFIAGPIVVIMAVLITAFVTAVISIFGKMGVGILAVLLILCMVLFQINESIKYYRGDK